MLSSQVESQRTTFCCCWHLFYCSFVPTCFRVGLYATRGVSILEKKAYRFDSNLSFLFLFITPFLCGCAHPSPLKHAPMHKYILYPLICMEGQSPPDITLAHPPPYPPSLAHFFLPGLEFEFHSYRCVYQYTVMVIEQEKLVVIPH